MRPITARDLMNPEVLTVRAAMSVDELAAFLLENEISGAPVEDDEGRLVGVVSLVDVATARRDGGRDGGRDAPPARPHFYRRGWEDEEEDDDAVAGLREPADRRSPEGGTVTVGEVMTPTLYTVDEEATVSQVASAMLDGHLHRLLVTGAGSSSVVGIITTSDLLGLLVEEPSR